LQLAGVPCEGTPNFWVNADGSYREEGQRNDRGYIWEKVIIVEMHVSFPCLAFIVITAHQYFWISLLQRRARLACAILSLPVPPKSVTLSCEGETPNKDSLPPKTLHKFLLVGSANSGASTIFKQVDFSLRELIFSFIL